MDTRPGKKTNADTPTEDETTRSQVYNRVDYQQEEEIKVQQELRIRESLMYEQLERASAAAAKATTAATSIKRGLPGGIHAAPFPYQGAPHLPPWMTGASRTAACTATSPTSAQPSADAATTSLWQ
jgi:cytochrome c1